MLFQKTYKEASSYKADQNTGLFFILNILSPSFGVKTICIYYFFNTDFIPILIIEKLNS